MKLKTILGRRKRNQQDATNLMFIIKLLSQYVSGIITPIIRRTRVCAAAHGVLHPTFMMHGHKSLKFSKRSGSQLGTSTDQHPHSLHTSWRGQTKI